MQSNDFSAILLGKNQITLPRIHSTNEFLKEELTKVKPVSEGTVIMAVDQYAGKGQQHTQWQSEPGKNLTASLLLCPTFLSPMQQFDLSIAISLGIQEAIQRIVKEEKVWIKWPNDLLIKDKKVGGILIENILRGNQWKYAIVGFGINVNQVSFPKDTKSPGSLYEILHETYDIQKLLNEICFFVEKYYSLIKEGKQSLLKSSYLANLYGRGKRRPFKINNQVKHGTITSIDMQGRLIVELDGQLSSFSFKEIEYLSVNQL